MTDPSALFPSSALSDRECLASDAELQPPEP
jgi:hypothetical protein